MKYIRYRSFLPETYLKRMEIKRNTSLKRTSYYLVILNLMLLPLNVNTANSTAKEEVITYVNDTKNTNNIENLLKWLSINLDSFNSIKVKDNEGEILLKNREEIYSLENKGFKIEEVTEIEESLKVKIRNVEGEYE